MCIPTPRGCNLARREIVRDVTTATILRRVLEIRGDSNSSEKPSAKTDVKDSQEVNNNNKEVILTQDVINRTNAYKEKERKSIRIIRL